MPSSNTTIETDFQCNAVLPRDVTAHVSRITLVDATVESAFKMNDEIERAAKELSTAKVDMIALACTSGSFLGGPHYDEEISNRIRSVSGIPATTTSTGVVEALRRLKSKSVAVATPYSDEINEKMRSFLEAHNFNVTNLKGLGLTSNLDIGSQTPEVIVKLAKETITKDSDSLFISCTNFQALASIQRIEQKIKKPVVTSNQATFWIMLRELKIPYKVKGYGRLFRQ